MYLRSEKNFLIKILAKSNSKSPWIKIDKMYYRYNVKLLRIVYNILYGCRFRLT